MKIKNILKQSLVQLFILLSILLNPAQINAQISIVSNNFNSGNDGWTTSDSWVNDNAADSKFTGSDGNYWHSTPFNNYSNNMNEAVISSVIDLTGYGNITLSVNLRYDTSSDTDDGMSLQYSIDGGATWTSLGSVGDGVNWFNNTNVKGISNGTDGWSGNNGSWQIATIALPSDCEDIATVKFKFIFGSDGNTNDDGVAFDDFSLSGYLLSNAVSNNFNTADEGWTTSGGWVRDNGADSKFSGSDGNYWRTNPFNNYSNNSSDYVTSGTLNLSGKTNLMLMVDVRYDSSSDGDDGFNIEYSDDGGTSWYTLGAVGEGVNWYNDANVKAISNGTDGWSNNNGAWKTASIQLPAVLENNANVKFRVHFASDASTTDDGFAFDNFIINEYSVVPPTPAKTWYAYSSSGNWSDALSWTLDGATNPLYVNPDTEVPAATDYVVIPSGKRITIQSTTNNLELFKLKVNGELDVTSSTGHNFNVITGNGKILLQGYNPGSGLEENFPDGTATLFIDADEGGTVELYGTGMAINAEREFNNLTVNLSSGSVTLLTDLVLNGDLTIADGDFKINDNSNTTPLNISVGGNVHVLADGTISVGQANAVDGTAASGYGNYHKYYHVFTVSGDFTNEGTVRLNNLTAPNYTTRTSTGAVSLVFNGASNNTLLCEGTTDLYYLVINKGTDQTYSLTINATDKANFALFGDNDEDWDQTVNTDPENRKALWIASGSLVLEGYVYIPTLTEGTRDFVIGENAALVLNGENVFVSITAISSDAGVHKAIDYTGLSYSTSSGINNGINVQATYIYGTLKINSGEMQSNNSHGTVYRAESPANKLEINGGKLLTSQFRISGDASASTAKMSYIQTGGEIQIIDHKDAAPAFDLRAELGSFTMSGGYITIGDLSSATNSAIEIACAVNNINITGGTILIDNSVGNAAVASISSTAPFHNLILRQNQGYGVKLNSDLVINNDLVLEAEDFKANNNDLFIGSDFTIENGASYTPGTNTTTFNGSKRTNLDFTGTIPVFNNLTVSKTVDEKDFAIFMSDQSPVFKVNGNFRLEKGAFDYGAFVTELKGNVYVADSLGKTGNSGKITLNGASGQTLTSSNGSIQNIEIDNGNGVSLSGDLAVYGTLTLTNGVFNIGTYGLTMQGSDASIAGTFGVGEMIQTAGNASDGGLKMFVDANETITFPIGTNANAVSRYTPLVAEFDSFVDSGYVQVAVADAIIPMTAGGSGDILSYYWKLNNSDFTTLPNVVSYTFTHDASDEDGGDVDTYLVGKVLNISPYTQSTESSNYNKTTNEIIFNAGFPLEQASYSAGASTRFASTPDIYYSRQSGNYNTASTWSKNDDTGSGTQEVPVAGSIVVIQNSNRVNVYASISNLGQLIFDHDYTTYPDAGSEDIPRLQFHVAGTFNLGSVSGTGMISFNAASAPVVTGDFGEFGRNTDSYYLYFGGNATLSNIPTPIPNLMMESYTYQINQIISTYGNVIVQGNGTIKFLKDASIAGDIVVGTWLGGTIQLPSQSTAVTLTVNGNIDFTLDPLSSPSNRYLNVQSSGSNNVEHKIILKGDILQGSSNTSYIDLWRSNTTERAIIELQGESNNTYTRTSTSIPEFYRVIMNKGIDQSYSFSFNNSFTLRGATNGTSNKAVELLNGKLILNNSSINIDLTTGNPFSIPSTAALEISAGTANANGSDGGITLDGSLIINGGTLDITDAGSDKNYIQYGASGNATINVSSGTLLVGTQIRRLTSNTNGVLNYIQTGGTVTIGVNSAASDYEESRGMLEVLNAGSNFTHTGGTLTIVRQNGNNPSQAALLLDPDTYDLTGSTITIGNNNTPESQNELKINSNIPLNNLTIYTPSLTDSPDISLFIRNLEITGDLLVYPNATLNGNGLDLTIGGDFTNNGIYVANNNQLIFNAGVAQSITGAGTEDIYKLTKTNTGTLTLEKDLTVNNLLDIDQGTIFTKTSALSAKKNVVVDGAITSTSGVGLVFNGTETQYLSRSSVGASSIDILSINNSNGVQVTNNGHSFYINTNLRLESGVFNISGSLLELSKDASIEEVNTFSISNMIQTNSSFQDNGIKKNFYENTTTDFILPVGQLTYTPITIDLSSSGHTFGSTPGSLIVRPANEYHPIINDGSDYFGTGDVNNVLQYYWILRANNINGFIADVTFAYDDSDIMTDDAAKDETNYIAAYILTNNNPTEAISKFDETNVIEASNTVVFTFNGDSDNGITGDYFVGVREAIPDNVATYTTVSNGDVTDDATYAETLPTDGVAPSGAVLVVSSGDELTFNTSGVKLYKTIIQAGGVLIINETDQHRLGTVTGTGTLKLVSSTSDISFPAGDYIDFFDCAGGGVEYSGSGSFGILSGLSSLRTLTLSGSGTKTMANNDVQICESFIINGPVFSNPSNSDVIVLGNMDVTSGTFNSGTSNIISVSNALTINGGTYNGGSGGADTFGSLIVSSGTFSVGTGGTISIQGDFDYTGGTFSGGSGASKISLNGTALQTVRGSFTGAAAMHNIEINNANGVDLAGDVTVNNQLTLTSGVITPGSNTLLIASAATIYPAFGSSSAYVNGKLHKEMLTAGDDFIFPIGKAGEYRPTSVYNVTTGGLTWEAEYFFAKPTAHASVSNTNPTNTTLIKQVSDIEYWVISDNGSSNANIGLSWGTESIVSTDQTERENLVVLKWNGSSWDSYGGGSFSSGHTQDNGYFLSNTALSFSTNIITLGTTDPNNALPVELLYFKGSTFANSVELQWATATEKNNDYFEIQRSADAKIFENLGLVYGSGNSATRIDYNFTDQNPLEGINYYRLKQVDYNGAFEYHKTIAVRWLGAITADLKNVLLYPNPYNGGNLTLDLMDIESHSTINLSIANANGGFVYSANIIVPDDKTIDLTSIGQQYLQSGVYIINIRAGSQSVNKKLIVN